jgi:hypothetical protein
MMDNELIERAMAAAEIELGRMTMDAGEQSGDINLARRGQVFLGQRFAVDDAENARLESEYRAMWADLRARGLA